MLDEHSAKKVRRRPEEGKAARTRLVGEEGSIQRNCFAVGICDGDPLRSGGEAGSYDEKSVCILECDAGSFSVNGERSGTLKATTPNCERGATGCGNSGRCNCGDSQWNRSEV